MRRGEACVGLDCAACAREVHVAVASACSSLSHPLARLRWEKVCILLQFLLLGEGLHWVMLEFAVFYD